MYRGQGCRALVFILKGKGLFTLTSNDDTPTSGIPGWGTFAGHIVFALESSRGPTKNSHAQ